jgi:hypothetical protein
MTRIPGRPHPRRGRELISLLASARPASLDPGPEPAPAALVAARLAAAEPAEAGPQLPAAAAGPGPGQARPAAPAGRLAVLGRLARPRLWAPVAAAAAVTAVAAAATIIALPGHAQHAGSGQTLSAAAVLDAAAAAAARQPAGHGRYHAVEYETTSGKLPPQLDNVWYGSHGYELGSSVPSFAGQAISVGLATPPTPAQQRWLLSYITQSFRIGDWPSAVLTLIFDFTGVPASLSALFRVAAMIPGLTAIPHRQDLTGRAATMVYVPGDTAFGLPLELFFDPVTSVFFGYSVGCGKYAAVAVLASGYVSSAHQLPPGAPKAPLPVVQPSLLPGCWSSATPAPSPAPAPSR